MIGNLASIEQWSKKLKMNPNAPTTQRLYENRHLTIAEYVAKFRRGRNVRRIPSRVLTFTIEELLMTVRSSRGIVEGVNVRKILIDLREKFER